MTSIHVVLVDHTHGAPEEHDLGQVTPSETDQLIGHLYWRAINALTDDRRAQVIALGQSGDKIALSIPGSHFLLNMVEPLLTIYKPCFHHQATFQLLTKDQMQLKSFVTAQPTRITESEISAAIPDIDALA